MRRAGKVLQRWDAEETRETHLMEGVRCYRTVTRMPVFAPTIVMLRAEGVFQRRAAGLSR